MKDKPKKNWTEDSVYGEPCPKCGTPLKRENGGGGMCQKDGCLYVFS